MADHTEIGRRTSGAHIQESLEQSRFGFDELIQPDEEHCFELEPLDVLDIKYPDIGLVSGLAFSTRVCSANSDASCA